MAGSRRVNGHAFISYVRDDSDHVDQLQGILEAAGIPVWRDTADLWPGENWREKIRRAITADALVFIACFSSRSTGRSRTYQNEELTLAIEELRLRNPASPWLIPVRLDDCHIPDRDIGGGRTLGLIQRVDLFGDRYMEGAARLVVVIRGLLDNEQSSRFNPEPDAPVQWLTSASSDTALEIPVSRQPTGSRRRAERPGYYNYKPAYIDYEVRVEGVLFNLGSNTGGLVVYTKGVLRGATFTIWINKSTAQTLAANVVERIINGRAEFAAVFSGVPVGTHRLVVPTSYRLANSDVSVFAAQVAEVDLR